MLRCDIDKRVFIVRQRTATVGRQSPTRENRHPIFRCGAGFATHPTARTSLEGPAHLHAGSALSEPDSRLVPPQRARLANGKAAHPAINTRSRRRGGCGGPCAATYIVRYGRILRRRDTTRATAKVRSGADAPCGDREHPHFKLTPPRSPETTSSSTGGSAQAKQAWVWVPPAEVKASGNGAPSGPRDTTPAPHSANSGRRVTKPCSGRHPHPRRQSRTHPDRSRTAPLPLSESLRHQSHPRTKENRRPAFRCGACFAHGLAVLDSDYVACMKLSVPT